MDEQEKEIEEILRTFDKAPSPSSENSVQSHFSAIGGDEVVMDNEERLLIARSHKQNLKEKHMEFVRRMV